MKTLFLFDGMLGRLCRKMRLLGYDSELAGPGDSHLFLLRAEEEGRAAVTAATRRVDRRGPPPVVLQRHGLASRIAEIFAATGETPLIEPFTICLECNAALRRLRPADAAGKVPPRVLHAHDSFRTCPICRRIYWEGSHHMAMARQIKTILERMRSEGLEPVVAERPPGPWL